MKKLLLVGLLAGGMALGEYVQPYTSAKEYITFSQVPIAKNHPVDPWNYTLQREFIDMDGTTYQGLFLVNEEQGIHKKIDEEGCTCGVGNSIDDFLYDTKLWIDEKVQQGKEWLGNKYEVKKD